MKKFILLIASILLLLSFALYKYHDVVIGTKVIKWEYEITNSLNSEKHTISFVFDEKSYIGFKNIKYMYSPNYDEITTDNKELEEFYNHLKNVVAVNFNKTLLNKYDMLRENTKNFYKGDENIEVYSEYEIKAIDWTYNQQMKKYDVTLQAINDFIETYNYSNKNDFEYVKIAKNNHNIELRLTKYEYRES